MENVLIKQMRLECTNSIFLEEEYDPCIVGYNGRSGVVVYDIDLLSGLELVIMNHRDYDIRIGINGGSAYYEIEDAECFWNKRFDNLHRMKNFGQLDGKFPPAFLKRDKDFEKDQYEAGSSK